MSSSDIKPLLTFMGQQGQRVGEDRFRLLEAVGECGSISAAAKLMGMSYRSAWDAINALNNLFPQPLVNARPGGKQGGGAQITVEGRRAIAAHKLLQEKLANVLAELDLTLGGADFEHNETSSLPAAFWSLTMKTSARNFFHGVISEVNCGAVNAEVTLQVSETTQLVIIITIKSVLALGLYPGKEAFAMIKASAPILMLDLENIRTSARNQLTGTVTAIEDGAVSSEVTLDIGAGKTLVTIVTKESVQSLNIKLGDRFSALIKSSHIILAVD